MIRYYSKVLILDKNITSNLNLGVQRITKSISKVKDLSEKEKSVSQVSPTTDWTDLKQVELVIEAVTENEQVQEL